ncbi:hypothetical protein L21SP3_02035 [Sedimentisphaera cyanobacteriorum]|uniref:Uncharacterized protein n=1 Tax=Sedimentisphaera cyanobacteriorum TaxID=1940790 RepID=A0A1Q2HRX9_9BACT|nr:hypothetical protein L21SP3_02035 [Sedimentisphaera cyanobacteriorum]
MKCSGAMKKVALQIKILIMKNNKISVEPAAH